MIVRVMKPVEQNCVTSQSLNLKYLHIVDFAYSARIYVMFSKKTNDCYMGLVATKPVFRVSNKGSFKAVSSGTETS